MLIKVFRDYNIFLKLGENNLIFKKSFKVKKWAEDWIEKQPAPQNGIYIIKYDVTILTKEL